jgi:signal transduction histidine kinase
MKLEQPRLFSLLLGSLLVMLVGLVGLTAILAHGAAGLDQVYRVIVDDTAPSIVELEAASTRLGHLEGLLRDRLRAAPSSRALLDADLAADRQALAASVAAYARLPADPGEAEVRARIQAAEERLDRIIARIRQADVDAGPVDDVARALDERVNELNAALFAAASINAEVLTRASGRLLTMRSAVLPAVVGLEVLCLLAAAITLSAAYRVVRTAAASGAAGRRELERRMLELDAFSARVAHDLLSPLMAVGFALAAAEHNLLTPEQGRVRAMVIRASSSLQRVRQMVADLLDFARAGATPPPGACADAAQALRDVAEDFTILAEEARVELVVETGSRRAVRCSAGVLRSVLSNLVQNAIRYIDGGGRVTVRAADDGADVRFEVEDTGPGISAADQQSIFEAYVRRSDAGPGLGLGLATVKRLAEAHGGQVGVDSTPGHGARFWVTLPGAG